jgi:hypothetical protein
VEDDYDLQFRGLFSAKTPTTVSLPTLEYSSTLEIVGVFFGAELM